MPDMVVTWDTMLLAGVTKDTMPDVVVTGRSN